jgi:hypothetical protein
MQRAACVPQVTAHELIDAKVVPARFESLQEYRNTLIPLVKLEVQAHLQQARAGIQRRDSNRQR